MGAVKKLKEWYWDRPFTQGTVLQNRYTIENLLGIGSYGICYLATDTHTSKKCVLKQQKPSKVHFTKEAISIEREATLLSSLSHPSIPCFHTYLYERRQYWLVMDYIPGKTIEQWLLDDRYSFNVNEWTSIFSQLLHIVQYLHYNHIVHRDIRIPNVIWHDGLVYLIDLGLAHVFEANDSHPFIHVSHDPYINAKSLPIHPQSDFYCLGHFLLFLLYSTYPTDQTETTEKSWEDELVISPSLKTMIRRLLSLESPYLTIQAIQQSFHILNI